MRESFVFYNSYYEAIAEFDEIIQVHLFRAICEYALYGKIPEFSGTEKALFTLIRPTIDANEKRYINGKKGGRPPKKTNGYENEKPTVINSETNGYENEKPNVNVNVNVNETDNVTDNETDNEENVSLPDKSDNTPKPPKPKKISFGEYQHIKLTQEQFDKLCEEFSENTIRDYIQKMDEWLQLNGKKPYKDFNLAIRNWLNRDNIKKRSNDYEQIFRSPDPNDAPF